MIIFFTLQPYLTTPTATTEMPVPSTAISLSPQTSISVQHTIVRNKPAYPYPYTESTMTPEGTEDTSYYYTYEDVSEDASKQITSTMTPMTTVSTTKPPVKSFWNSQKAILDARRKENAQKFVPTYNKPSAKEKTVVEFKTREKPKFGLANKNKQYTTTTRMPESTTSKPVELSTSNKMVKSDIQLNLPIQNLADKDLLKSLKNVNLLPNQIIGRLGDIPVQSNLAQIQAPLRAQSSNINSFRPSKFDNSVRNAQYVDNARQAPSTNTQNQPNPQNIFNAAALLKSLQNLNQQRSAQLNLNPPIQSNTQPILNLNQNQQPLLNLNQKQTPLLNTNQNQQPQAPSNAFISASAPFGTSGRAGELSIQAPSSLLQRLGALGLGGANGNNAVMGRDGGGYGGGGNGVTLNLGQIPDPLTFFLRLLSLIPRPLLDLNGRVFFGIELGKNAGLVSGAGGAKPYNG